jgi:hypothetical protein
MTTLKPSLTRRFATSPPMPPEAPVMTALFLTEFVTGDFPFTTFSF